MLSSFASVTLLVSTLVAGAVASPVTSKATLTSKAAAKATSSKPNCSGGTTRSDGAVVLGTCQSLDVPSSPATKSASDAEASTSALPLPINPTSSYPVVFLPPPPEPSGIATARPSGYNCDAPERWLSVQVTSNLESLIPSMQIVAYVFNSSTKGALPLGFYQGSCYLGRYGFNDACSWIKGDDWKYPVISEIKGSGAAKGGKYTVEHDGFDAFDEYHDNVVLGGFGPGAGSCAWQNLGNCISDTHHGGGGPSGPVAIQSMTARCYQSGTVPGTIPSVAATPAPSVQSYISKAMDACSDATKKCVPSTSLKSGQIQTITINSACHSAMEACATM